MVIWLKVYHFCMNGHWFTTMVSNPDLPVAIHTQSHQIPFQEYWSVCVIHKLSDSTPDHICRFETAYQLVLQSRDTPWSQHPLTPQIPPSPQWHLKSQLSLFYSTAEEGQGDLTESLPFSFRFISVCLSDDHPWAGRCCHLA